MENRLAANAPHWVPEGPSVARSVEELEIRLAKAQARFDRMRRTGPHDSYLEAHALVVALQRQLDRAVDDPQPAPPST